MGFLLKEVLKTLCGPSQWSYAVFWKIGCQNPKLLIWEDCYYEPSASCALHIAGSETFRECERSWDSPETRSSQLRIQAGDRVHSLINVMMINNQVNVVGEGIVGRAAFTGNHQWILSNNYTGAVHPPEVLNEVLHQFAAGIQTVAVIPILPHGVVQLGSSLSIMENIGFVNDVRSLILQLGCVPSALFSNKYETKDTAEKIGVPFLGVPVSLEPSEVTNSLPSTVDICNQQSNLSHDSLLVCQSSHPLIRETQNKKFPPPDQAQMLPQCHDEHCQPKATPIVKPNFPINSQLENGVVGAEVIPSNPGAWLNQQACFYSSISGYNNQPGFSQLGGRPTTQNSMEQQIFLGSAVQDHLNKNSSESSTFKMSRLRTSGGLMLDPHIGSVTSLCGESKLHGGISNHLRPNSIPCTLPTPHRAADTNLSGIHLTDTEVQYVYSSKTRGVSLSSHADQVPAGHMLSGEDHRPISTVMKHNENELVPSEQKMDSDSFQVLDILYAHPEKHMSMSKHIPGLFAHCQNCDNGSRTPSTIGKHEYTSAQPPSGDDLFDILGVEFKNKLLNDTRNNFLADGPDANLQDLGENSSVLMGMLDVGADLFSECEGVSESGIFSGMGSDHLLDAVVSRAHSTSKQRLDDDVSCRTALTNISSSSVPSSSATYGRVGMSDHVQGELFGLPKPQGKKVGTVEASSLRSGCSKDDAGNLSQATSIYGSHISSWVEQGNNVKCDNSVSTAYSKKPDEINKSNRKRLKPGENPRPRPKDRQMIQDRVKELREIVPNGAKCSIDSLLERTIKHMLFLQSVTKHADKLKQTGDSKIVSKDGGLLLKDNFEGGATWAYEVSSQSMVCPIIVEDLNPPRQMLVEMLCEERGFFLEIAEIIRGLGLTILKGVMEARNDKVWARFAVEANRDITRMEIFMSLVRLLEQTVKPCSIS